MTAPSELAELILEWAEERKPLTFTTAKVYQDLNFIDTHKEVSDSLRYMFKKGIIARKKRDSRSFEYALADVAPDDFEMYGFRPIAQVYEPEEQEKNTLPFTEKAVDVAIQCGNSFAKLTASESGVTTENISPADFWNTSEEIKESSPLDIEHFNAVYDEDKSDQWIDITEDKAPVFNIEDWKVEKILAELKTDDSDTKQDEIDFNAISKGYDGISNSPVDSNVDVSQDFLFRATIKADPADSIQIGGDHYKKLNIQPWSAMQSWMNKEQFMGFLRGNIIKYVARCDIKGGIEDLKKARHYLDKLIEVSERG